jgi:hypothetical protein
MRHSKAVLALLIVIGVPAAAKTLIKPAEKCFAADATVYRFAAAGDRAMTVRVGSDVPAPDVSIRVTDSPELADFILIDDQENTAACRRGPRVPSTAIRLSETGQPDLRVSLSEQAADGDYRIYVRSATFSTEEAAALFAVMVTSTRRIAMAAR